MNEITLLEEVKQAFNQAKWDALRELFHEGQSPEGWRNNLRHFRDLHGAGFRINFAVEEPYEQPAWSIFNLYEYHPVPETALKFELLDRTATKMELLFAVKRGRICYYRERKKRRSSPKPQLDLHQDLATIRSFVLSSISEYAGAIQAPVSILAIHFSTRDGIVAVSFESLSFRRFEDHPCCPYRKLSIPDWAVVFASEPQRLRINNVSGEIQIFTKEGFGKITEQVGWMLVHLLIDLNLQRKLAILPKLPGAEMEVEELSGLFGWPHVDDRGVQNVIC